MPLVHTRIGEITPSLSTTYLKHIPPAEGEREPPHVQGNFNLKIEQPPRFIRPSERPNMSAFDCYYKRPHDNPLFYLYIGISLENNEFQGEQQNNVYSVIAVD